MCVCVGVIEFLLYKYNYIIVYKIIVNINLIK